MEKTAIIKLYSIGQKWNQEDQQHSVLKSGKVLSFGRNKWCTRILRFPEASKTHFVITSPPKSKKVWIIDLSQNGTIIRNLENSNNIKLHRDIFLLENGQKYEISINIWKVDYKDQVEEKILSVEVHDFLIHQDAEKERNLILKWCKNLGFRNSRTYQDKKIKTVFRVPKIKDNNFQIEQPYNVRSLNKVIDQRNPRRLPFLKKKKQKLICFCDFAWTSW
eukprot:TRINITY_DN11706_c0_g3_i1.p1 TRINITY_DN11706_c0_g3~~TRINITY_DN11706_c0_g3_i1.p1  ORF type:complete len:228 (-),score=16.75 TRINITY_DN11706_c0_g3_i1:1-660(-)